MDDNKGYDDVNVEVTDDAIETRRNFYDIYLKNENKIPDGWDFNEKTIYSDHPTLVKCFNNKKVMVRINVFGDNIKIQGLTRDMTTENIDNAKEMVVSSVDNAVASLIDEFVLEYEYELTV